MRNSQVPKTTLVGVAREADPAVGVALSHNSPSRTTNWSTDPVHGGSSVVLPSENDSCICAKTGVGIVIQFKKKIAVIDFRIQRINIWPTDFIGTTG